MPEFPRPIEGGNTGDGAPLTLGDPNQLSELFVACAGSSYVLVNVFDLDGDGATELVGSGGGIFTFRPSGALRDGTPIVNRGLRWGDISRAPHRDRLPEDDFGLCGTVLTHGDFDGDGCVEAIVGPQSIGTGPIMAISTKDGAPTHRTKGDPVYFEGEEPKRPYQKLAAIDWDGDGRMDLVALLIDRSGNEPFDPATGKVSRDVRERYTLEGQWKGKFDGWSLHLFRNTGVNGKLEFTYSGMLKIPDGRGPFQDVAGAVCAVDPTNSSKGLLLIGYYGDLWHLPLIEAGSSPKWGGATELLSLHGAPFTREAAFTSIDTGDFSGDGRADLFASDNSSNVYWCKYWGEDENGRPIYDDPRKIKQRDPHVNGGWVSVPTAGDWSGTGMDDLVVGGVEGYVLWYRTLSTDPLRFAHPERVRVGDEEIRRYAKPNPSGGYHWGSSQSPDDGFNGGYSNPLLVDWDGDGLLDLLVGDMIGIYDWYPNRGLKTWPKLDPPLRLHCDGETLLGPWRVRPGAADFSGDGLPDLVTMDHDLDLSLFRRVGRDDLTALLPGVKLRYEDGDVIKTHGVSFDHTSGDGRGRTKIDVVDWNGDGRWDLVLGVGPQYFSAFRSSYVLLSRNVGTNAEPIFERPEILLFDDAGAPLEFWRHGVHPAVVDWDRDGKWEIVVGADKGMIWYFKPDHFGTSNILGGPNPARDPDDKTL
jgi:hypothetical protein